MKSVAMRDARTATRSTRTAMPTTSNRFSDDLQRLRDLLLEMGVATEEMVGDAIRALVGSDLGLADAVLKREALIDRLDLDIETLCLHLMARRISASADRRLIGTALKIVTDMERIAGHAIDIARIVQRMSGEVIYKPLVDIPRLGEIAQTMLRESLNAFVLLDVHLALTVVAMDDRADSLYGRMRRDLATVLQQDHDSVLQASYLNFIAHYLERICDHCTNIAEHVRFLVTGRRNMPDQTDV